MSSVNLVTAATLDIYAYRADDNPFVVEFYIDELQTLPFSLAGFSTLSLGVAKKVGGSVFLVLGLGTGLTVGGGSSNELTIAWTPAQIDIPDGDYRYDLEGVTGSSRTTILRGRLNVSGDVV